MAALLRATSPGLLPPEAAEPPTPQAVHEAEAGSEAGASEAADGPVAAHKTRTDLAGFAARAQVEPLGTVWRNARCAAAGLRKGIDGRDAAARRRIEDALGGDTNADDE